MAFAIDGNDSDAFFGQVRAREFGQSKRAKQMKAFEINQRKSKPGLSQRGSVGQFGHFRAREEFCPPLEARAVRRPQESTASAVRV
jgi:hypothetical protein